MWTLKTKWAGAVMLLAVICFMFADCTKEQEAAAIPMESQPAALSEEFYENAGEANLPDESASEDGTGASGTSETELESAEKAETPQTETVKEAALTPEPVKPTPAPAPAPTPPEPPKKYSVVGPDGVTYTGYEPMYIICLCGEKFTSGSAWQSHRNYYSTFRCSCGGSFPDIGPWESHAGIYDAKTYMYTGKTRAEAASEGHTLTNEDTHTAEYNAHNGWKTTGFPG